MASPFSCSPDSSQSSSSFKSPSHLCVSDFVLSSSGLDDGRSFLLSRSFEEMLSLSSSLVRWKSESESIFLRFRGGASSSMSTSGPMSGSGVGFRYRRIFPVSGVESQVPFLSRRCQRMKQV